MEYVREVSCFQKVIDEVDQRVSQVLLSHKVKPGDLVGVGLLPSARVINNSFDVIDTQRPGNGFLGGGGGWSITKIGCYTVLA